ncbi:MAG: HAD family hydrolase, partial [Sphaerochaetaceae bacterium]
QCNAALWRQFEKGLVTIDELKVKRFAAFGKEAGISLDAEEASRSYQYHLSRQGILFDESITVLETLKERGYSLFLATNGIAEVQRGRIEVSRTGPYFEHIFISEEVGYQKPDPRFFSYMLEVAGLTKQKHASLMIGDSLSSDIAGGIASGIDTLWLNKDGEKASNSQVKPTYTQTSLPALLAFLTDHL